MRILVAGDFVPRNRIVSKIENKDYSFFNEIIAINKECDYSIINFESPIIDRNANPIVKTGPNIKCHKNTMEAVKYAGFNCVTLANNHFYDYGEIGVKNTIDACINNSIDYVGGGINIDEAEKILYKSIDNKKLAIINICENEWSIATKTTGGSAPLNIVSNVRKIKEAKKKADFVLMIIHGGTEHYQLPSPRMKDTYRFFIEEGADAVVNHHQHCYSGYEIYKGKPIFYGLGNFCFDKNNPKDALWNEGYAVMINFNSSNISYKILPYVQCAEKAQICFLSDTEKFEQHISNLNSIIVDDNVLLENFIEMANRKRFLQFLEPYTNKYLKILRSKGLLPSFLNSDKKNIILEIFKCESHRDVMFELLKKR